MFQAFLSLDDTACEPTLQQIERGDRSSPDLWRITSWTFGLTDKDNVTSIQRDTSEKGPERPSRLTIFVHRRVL
jgi:hypothetical protein